ncbi:hypothetical protein [Lactiplantibacillus fabifermentans]|uniref:Extracellular protein n=2 Tax=Lactiplantibacillus fabifermentans TaxID=483011 RepID=A0A0R2NKW3_9LACO|nr:hypothetical protein [Lactiplantibacillus fabifermentans]ETY75156.1 hypothetical protein LFAB_03375 [Lactiplantibacillus fabifermentans T30PCM01]KRO26373.1 hypothetical protein DY78_GL001029 [Lactiplantibacillus fabifermentans DSM 21115]
MLLALLSFTVLWLGLNAPAQAMSNVKTMPASLRGTWYEGMSGHEYSQYKLQKNSSGFKDINRKNKVSNSYKAQVVKKLKGFSGKPKYAVIQKQKNGWYGISYNFANGISQMKRGTYKLKGRKYTVLYRVDLSAVDHQYIQKKIRVNVLFHKRINGVHTTLVSSKGMFK